MGFRRAQRLFFFILLFLLGYIRILDRLDKGSSFVVCFYSIGLYKGS